MLARFLSGLGKTMVSVGVIVFLFVSFKLWGTELEESQLQGDLTDELSRTLTTTPGATSGSTSAGAEPKTDDEPQTLDEITDSLGDIDPADSKKLPKPAEGESLGVMHLKTSKNQAGIDMRKVFIEGTDKDDLKAGPGHYPGTPFPGQKGNASIAGHRVTYGAPFRRIDELVPADEQGPAH